MACYGVSLLLLLLLLLLSQIKEDEIIRIHRACVWDM